MYLKGIKKLDERKLREICMDKLNRKLDKEFYIDLANTKKEV